MRPESHRGFTLLELLVAVAILAMIAVGSYRLLAGTVATRDQGLQHMRALHDLQKAEMILQRDLLQTAARPIRDEFGDNQPGFLLQQDNVMELTRRGWRNPLQENRSDLVRVRYRVANEQLIRERWSVLDRDRASTPEKIVLLDHVQDFRLQVFANGGWMTLWPTLVQSQKKAVDIPLPEAVEITFSLAPYGAIRRVIPLPENEATAPSGSDGGSNGGGSNGPAK
ncbi:MAG TPA: type II secretion system minor pseudopilin GspJ [Moraxellaceae bacterium]